MLNSKQFDIRVLEDLQLSRCAARALRQLNDSRLFYGLASNQARPAEAIVPSAR